MKIFCLMLALYFSGTLALAQGSQELVHFRPKIFENGQTVTFTYQKDSSIFRGNKKILCKVFFSGINDAINTIEYPKVFEPKLHQRSDSIYGTFMVPEKATGVVLHFFDTLSNVDNNNGIGYWRPVYTRDNILEGSLSSIASVLGHASLNLKCDKRRIRELFEADFENNPVIKRRFNKEYLNSFDVHQDKNSIQFQVELEDFSRNIDLNEKELLDISRHYSALYMTDSANRYRSLAQQKYPNGSVSTLRNSLAFAIQIDTMKRAEEKWILYQDFKAKYDTCCTDSFTRMIMQNRRGKLLRGMAVPFIKANKISEWESEVEMLDDKPKHNAYYRTAHLIIEHVQGEESTDLSDRLRETRLKAESKLTVVSKNHHLIEYSEMLARQAVIWFRAFVHSPRNFQDEPWYTDAEIRDQREYQLALVLDVLGQSLLLQNKSVEAIDAFKEATILARRGETSISEHLIESLILGGDVHGAVVESGAVIALNNSTSRIDKFHNENASDTISRKRAVAKLRASLKKNMTNSEVPDSTLLNRNGEAMTLKALKGKTIVIDFWATWCMPCIIGLESSITTMNRFRNQEDVVFLFVNTEKGDADTKAKIYKKLNQLGLDLNVVFDPDLSTTRAFGIQAIPTIIVIDSNGMERFRKVGIDMKKGGQGLAEELIIMVELVR
jgi:thiol-disulfide isomerase/thioredoxin